MRILLTIDDKLIEGEDIQVECDDINVAIRELQSLAGKNHAEAMQRYMDAKRKKLEVFTGNIFGWKKKGNNLVPNWEQQRVILMMKRWHASGRGRKGTQIGFNKIAKRLNDLELKGSKGGNWTSSSVARTVRNTIHDQIDRFEKPDWW